MRRRASRLSSRCAPGRSRRRIRLRRRRRRCTRRTRRPSTRRSPVDPEDAELWILRGNAEEPGPWGRGQFGGAASIAFYEAALLRAPGHFGAHHYLVHSYENIGQHAEAARHGKIYADSSPAIAHAQHMYGHVLPRLGRWNEALVQFEKADAIEEAYARSENLRPGDDWHHLHNLHLLAYTYLRLGRYRDAETTFRRAFDTPSRLAYRGTPQASLAEFYLLRGNPEEALRVAQRSRFRRGRWPRAWPRPSSKARPWSRWAAWPQARVALTRAEATLEEGRPALGYQARYLDLFTRPYVDQLATEIDLRGSNPASAEASLRKVADELSTNPRFDAWGEGLFPARPDRRNGARFGSDTAGSGHRGEDEEDRSGLSARYDGCGEPFAGVSPEIIDYVRFGHVGCSGASRGRSVAFEQWQGSENSSERRLV